MSWAQGGNQNNGSLVFTDEFTSAQNSNILSDPMAPMAGPYYSDMMRAKLNDASKFKNTYDPSSLICSIESHEIFLQERSAVDKLEEAKVLKLNIFQYSNVIFKPSFTAISSRSLDAA
jgi:hypothetical protein